MQFRVLGPFEVAGADGAISLPRAKLRTLLAILLLRPNGVVSADALIEALWRGAPPASAPKLVQLYVSQLRRALGAKDRIETCAPGYVLVVASEELDSSCFERLLTEGRVSLAAGNPARARRALGQALELWRGPALHEFADDEFARAEAGRLDELRLAAVEDRVEADLELGKHEELVPELRALIDESPLRERRWRQLMLALYRADRQAEALDCYREARRILRDELGLEPGDELRQLQAAILRQDPTLVEVRRRGKMATNLPAPLTDLLGRDGDVALLVQLLRGDAVRLLTLTGPGGAGKTSLAIEVARALQDDFANGVFLVELAPVRDSALVPAALAAALGIEPEASGSPLEAVRRRLAGEELLLVVDNAEHLPDVGLVLVELVHAAPDLRLLVTSRSVLHLSGERVYPVPPLDPDPAVQLFLARARAAQPAFEPDGSEALVQDICDRLDRLPLAIELAAPRTRALSLEALHARLAQRLPLLTAGPRDLPDRQQTLRATLEWSYELLSPEEKQALRRLAVFAGSFTPDAGEEVAVTSLATLEALLEQNLVSRHEGGRLVLLETVREYALERLSESGEEAETSSRHAACMLRIARSANLTIEAEGPMRHELVIPEHHNIRAALEWAVSSGNSEMGLRLAVALENFWVSTGDPSEGTHWLESLLAQPPQIPSELHAHALRALGNCAVMSGSRKEGIALYEQSHAEFRELGNELRAAITLNRIAYNLAQEGDHERARELCAETLPFFQRIGFAPAQASCFSLLGELERWSGDLERSIELYSESIALSRETGLTWWEAGTQLARAEALFELGRPAEARCSAAEGLEVASAMRDRLTVVCALALLSRAAAEEGDERLAGHLWGAIEAEMIRSPLATWAHVREALEVPIRARVGERFEAALVEGRALALEEAVGLGLEPAGV